MASEAKIINLNLRITQSLRDRLAKLAERDRRNLSDYCRLALERAADEAEAKGNAAETDRAEKRKRPK